jgi:hypothetical protein
MHLWPSAFSPGKIGQSSLGEVFGIRITQNDDVTEDGAKDRMDKDRLPRVDLTSANLPIWHRGPDSTDAPIHPYRDLLQLCLPYIYISPRSPAPATMPSTLIATGNSQIPALFCSTR